METPSLPPSVSLSARCHLASRRSGARAAKAVGAKEPIALGRVPLGAVNTCVTGKKPGSVQAAMQQQATETARPMGEEQKVLRSQEGSRSFTGFASVAQIELYLIDQDARN